MTYRGGVGAWASFLFELTALIVCSIHSSYICWKSVRLTCKGRRRFRDSRCGRHSCRSSEGSACTGRVCRSSGCSTASQQLGLSCRSAPPCSRQVPRHTCSGSWGRCFPPPGSLSLTPHNEQVRQVATSNVPMCWGKISYSWMYWYWNKHLLFK